ncbi:MAG: hypothetical protein K8R59_02675 [Thermoanaerobaculales bacterium]|nr:hypothetical protein [Thermoanaerobaculales bacterium]
MTLRLNTNLAWGGISAGLGITLLLAPQMSYLRGGGANGPFWLSISLIVLCGAAFGLLWCGFLRTVGSRLQVQGRNGFGFWMLVCHLPLLLLWLPGAGAGIGTGLRPHLWILASTILLLLTMTTLRIQRRAEASTNRWWLVFLGATGGSFLASLAVPTLVGGGPAGIVTTISWGVYLLIASLGWGVITNRLLFPGRTLDWGMQAALGLAVLISVGGIINLTWMISELTVFLILAVGVGAVFADFPARLRLLKDSKTFSWRVEDFALIALSILVVTLAGLQLAASAAGTVDTVSQQPAFDLHDDHQAYLVFPHKMLALGSMGPEPFEGRRMLSMGGQSFLQTLSLVALPVRALHLVEIGLAPLILLGLVVGFGRRRQFDSRLILFTSFLVLSIPHFTYRGNTSAVVIGIVMMFAWFRIVADDAPPSQSPIAAAVVTALAAAALCSLKSTFIPAAVVFFGVTSCLGFIATKRKRDTALEILMGAGLILLFCLPWMLSILESSGTLLYPIFGKGFYGSVFTHGFSEVSGDFMVSTLSVVRAVWRHTIPLLPLLILVVFVRESSPRRPALALAVSAVLSIFLFVVMGDPEIYRSLTRYAFPVSTAAFLALIVSAFALSGQKLSQMNSLPIIAGISVGVVSLLANQQAVRTTYDRVIINLFAAGNAEHLVCEKERETSRLLDTAMADDGMALATLKNPFLLDFSRRKIFIMSLPAMAGLPPGLPLYEGGEAVAQYLMSRSIRFLAYGGFDGHERLLKLTDHQIKERYPHSQMRWVMLRYHERYNRIVLELAGSRKHLYEDEHTILLDLAVRVKTFRPGENPDRLTGFVDDVWTEEEAMIHGLRRDPGEDILVLRTKGWRPAEHPEDGPPVQLYIAGKALAVVEQADEAIAFRLPPETPPTFDLSLHCRSLNPTAIGAKEDTAPLGIDVDRIEIQPEDTPLGEPLLRRMQVVEAALQPSHAWNKSGFHKDHGWTNGDAVIDDLRWVAPEGSQMIRLSLHRHPLEDDIEKLAPRMWVNGIELYLCGRSEDGLAFYLYEGLQEINRIRIASSIFVPRQQRPDSTDERTLGIPIRSISLAKEG